MRVFISLDREEIQEQIPYAIICETMEGSRWGSGSVKRAYLIEFTVKERTKISREMRKLSYDWYLRRGVPSSVCMTPQTLNLWQRLGNFCGSI